MIEEIWKEIKNYEGIYWISSDGNIKNKKGMVLKNQINNSGYYLVHLSHLGKRKAFSVHRLVAIAFIPNGDLTKQVNHIDLNKRNNNYKNLEWCTSSENIKHLFASGKMKDNCEKAKVRMANIGRKFGRNNGLKLQGIQYQKILQLDLNGKVITSFKSFRELEYITGFDRKEVSKSIEKKRPYKGFVFERITDQTI